jgi:hypothetical protein
VPLPGLYPYPCALQVERQTADLRFLERVTSKAAYIVRVEDRQCVFALSCASPLPLAPCKPVAVPLLLNMKVFLTSGTGYVGAAIVERLLASGHHVGRPWHCYSHQLK